MPTYQYINADHSLVLRDDHVIAWDPKADAPLNQQPSAPSAQQPALPPAPRVPGLELEQEQHKPAEVIDEVQLWKDAGSPKPTEMARMPGTRNLGPLQPASTVPPWEEGLVERASAASGIDVNRLEAFQFSNPDIRQDEIDNAAALLDEVEATLVDLRPDDVAGLRAQVQALVKGLHVMIHAQRKTPPPRPPGLTTPQVMPQAPKP